MARTRAARHGRHVARRAFKAVVRQLDERAAVVSSMALWMGKTMMMLDRNDLWFAQRGHAPAECYRTTLR